MPNKKMLVTGSAGLIGSESVKYYCQRGHEVVGIDNDMRAYFFGEEASTDWNRELLEKQYSNYQHINTDIRNQDTIAEIFQNNDFDLIIHAAAQPSHDWAAKEPYTDFSINATGTLNLLEAYRKHCPEATFIFTSTNKVYGDTPNTLPLIELETRFEIDPAHPYGNGIDETMTLDDSKHSIFGASKLAADIMVQEYGKYFNLNTVTFRGGCLTGPSHSGTKLHGFLAYLIKCIAEGQPYTIFGYKGKQVRDNIHSSDLISAFDEVYKAPRSGEAYNIGGARYANISMMEAIEKIEDYLNRKGNIEYSEQNRIGDHIWYVSDVSKFKEHYPNWDFTHDIDDTITEICDHGHFIRPQVSNVIVSEVGIGHKPQVFVASHVSEAFGPVQALKSYLIKNYSSFLFVEHPLTYSGIQSTSIGTFRGSLPSREEKHKGSLSFAPLTYIRDFLLTFITYLRKGRSSRLYIGVDALNAFAGVILKAIGFRFTLVYYAVDYSPKRFNNTILNSIYRAIDTISARGADFVWNSSPPLYKLRQEQGISPEKNMLVPNGVFLEKIKPPKGRRRNRNTLVVVEHLTQEKGIQLLIKALPELKKINPKVKLVIYGTGPFGGKLLDFAERTGVADIIDFKGNVDPQFYLDELGKYGIGICLHRGRAGSYVRYSDPTSPKELMACGLPVVVSNHLWIARDIEERALGVAIDYNEGGLVKAVQKLWDSKYFYNKCAKNAESYTKELSWYSTFHEAFASLQEVKSNEKD